MVSKGIVAANLHANMCSDDGFGYAQGDRWGGGQIRLWTVDGYNYKIESGDYDCSSSVITAWRAALSNTKWAHMLDGASYTGNIESVFIASGLFEVKPMSFLAEPGDLYLKPGSHVAMCQTQVPDVLSEFSINEHGGISGGQRGDQTGREAYVHGYYDFADRIIHYNGKADADVKPAPEPPKAYSTKLYQSNNTVMQQFKLVKHGEHYEIVSVGRPTMALDVYDGSSKDHSPVRVYLRNGTNAQLFDLLKVRTKHGFICYEIIPVCAPKMRVDCVNGGTANKTGLQIHPYNGTDAQRWFFIEDSSGIVRIASAKSGLVIDCGSGIQP